MRGLGAQFTRVRINGLEAVSTTGGADSSDGANRSRAFDFNTFASELFSNLTVHKTSSADLDEGSLGATVDLNTGRPLDMAEDFTFAANAQLGYNDASEEVDPRTSFLIAGKNDAGTLGWLATYSQSTRNTLEQGFSSVRWTTKEEIANCSACADQAELATLNEGFFPRIPRYGKFTHEQERQGFTGTLQWQPTDRTEILVDYLTSRFDATRDEEYVSVSLKDGGNYPEFDVTDYALSADGKTITSMTVDNYDLRVEHRYDELETKFDQFSIRASHDFTDRLRGDVLWGASESNFSNPMQTTAIVDAIDVQNEFTYNATTAKGSIDFADFDTSNPANFDFVELRHRPNTVDNSFDTVALNLEFDLNDRMSLKGGISSKSFEFDVEENRAGPKFSGISATSLQGRSTSMNGITWFSPDVGSTLSTYAADVAGSMAPRAQDIRNVREEDSGVYVQLSWSEIAGLPLRGNFGVRHVTTEVESTGLTDLNGDLVQVVVDNEYTDTLPSLNLAMDVREDMVMRFSVADVMARPALGDLTPGGEISQFTGDVEYGNPNLDPFRARAYDLSYEWYFSDDAVFAAAYFYKDVETFIRKQTFENQPWSATGFDTSVLRDEGTFDENSDWSISRNFNGDGGEISGFELQYQQLFFDNYGLILNYTYVDSEMNHGTEEEPNYGPLNNQSKNSYNATVYYENEDFSARLSYAARDDYNTRPQGQGRDGNDVEYTEGTSNIDFVASYHLNDNWKVSFEGINLTDEPNRQMLDSAGRISVDHTYGRQYYIGTQYKF
ncbi:TonB-dependent receptor [Microbulbifer taiwanensis]|uniref:TonB-dependent receptor n=1 Tax=Microbulbifer taiwanensis TaxID=986746 RepID=UPI0036214127